MTNTKNNPPIYAEEQIVNEEQKILNKQKVIPQDFVELVSYGKNYSTEDLPKTLCWRYNFAYENGKRWITLDIPQKLMGKLGLEPGKNCSDLVFISPKVLKREPECGGITLQSEKEIFLASQGSRLVREKTTQTNLNIKDFAELEKKLKELNTKYNQLRSDTSNALYPEANIPALAILDEHLIAQAQEVINKLNNLRGEKNQRENQNKNLQQNITTLQNEITQLNNNLTTTQQEKDQLQQKLKRSLIGSLFKNKQKNKRISELNNSLSFLRGLLVDKNQQVDNLTTQKDNLQNQVNQLTNQINDLNQQLTDANILITNKDNEITGLRNKIGELETAIRGIERERDNIRIQRDNRPNITLTQWNNLQTQLNSVRTELNNTKNERDSYCNWKNNHYCSCSRTHCDDSSNCSCFCKNYGEHSRNMMRC